MKFSYKETTKQAYKNCNIISITKISSINNLQYLIVSFYSMKLLNKWIFNVTSVLIYVVIWLCYTNKDRIKPFDLKKYFSS